MQYLGETRLMDYINQQENALPVLQELLESIFNASDVRDLDRESTLSQDHFFKRVVERFENEIKDPYPYANQAEITINDKVYENPFSVLKRWKSDQDHFGCFIRHCLKIHVTSKMFTDVSTLNVMVTYNAEGAPKLKLIDPGRLESVSPTYPLGKLLGSFSRYFSAINEGRLQLEESEAGHYTTAVLGSDDVKRHNQEFFSHAIDVLDKVESAKSFRQKEPLYKVQLLMTGWLQFGANMKYRTNDAERKKDFVLFTIGMDYMKSVFQTLYEKKESAQNLEKLGQQFLATPILL